MLACIFLAFGCGVQARVRERDGTVRAAAVHGDAANAIERASNEIPCPTTELTVESLGAGGYRVSGCGVQITYTCAGVCAPSERTSTAEAFGTSVPRTQSISASQAASGAWTDEQVHQLQASLHEPVLACLPAETARLRLRVSISAAGMVRRVAGAPQSDRVPLEAGACIDRVLQSGRMGATASASRYVTLEFERGAPPDSDRGATVPDGQPPSSGEAIAAPPAIPASVDAAVRAAVDARAPAILACVDDAALALQVAWTRDGHLDALLRGERQGTPEEACVRAVVQAITIAPPRSPGTIVHAVQR